jgi:hypothetical protein
MLPEIIFNFRLEKNKERKERLHGPLKEIQRFFMEW